MSTIKTSLNQSLLIDKGILSKLGEICKDKINLISGAMASPFIETILVFTGYDAEASKRVVSFFSDLYQRNLESEMMAILHILYDVLGLQFPEDAELLGEHSEARQYFLFSFLLDMDDCMQDFILEATGR